jgi:hypothetical protein
MSLDNIYKAQAMPLLVPLFFPRLSLSLKAYLCLTSGIKNINNTQLLPLQSV